MSSAQTPNAPPSSPVDTAPHDDTQAPGIYTPPMNPATYEQAADTTSHATAHVLGTYTPSFANAAIYEQDATRGFDALLSAAVSGWEERSNCPRQQRRRRSTPFPFRQIATEFDAPRPNEDRVWTADYYVGEMRTVGYTLDRGEARAAYDAMNARPPVYIEGYRHPPPPQDYWFLPAAPQSRITTMPIYPSPAALAAQEARQEELYRRREAQPARLRQGQARTEEVQRRDEGRRAAQVGEGQGEQSGSQHPPPD